MTNKEKVGIKRLDHMCWAGQELDDAWPSSRKALGMRVVNRWQGDEPGYRGRRPICISGG